MKSPRTTRAWIVALAFGLSSCAWAQDSLGDVARKTRKEHSATDHVVAKQVTNEEEDGPDAGGVWRVRLCVQTPCYELSVTLPKSPKWNRDAEQPRPVVIPLAGHHEDPSHAIRIYAAEALPRVYTFDGGTRVFLQGWFARPEYFGQAARIGLRKNVLLDSGSATIAQFTVNSDLIKYRGVSVVAVTSYGDHGFACVFPDEDSKDAASTCDAIVASAKTQTIQPAMQTMYPYYPNPPTYYPRYDPPDPPEDDDPQ